MTDPIRLCSLDGCNKKRKAKGFCEAHYQRFRRHGDPLKGRTSNGGASKGEPLKFLEDAVKNPDPDACVIWTFGVGSHGYGAVWKDGQMVTAHRLALIMHGGVDHPHLHAAHGPCHNRLCVNPLHLRWATGRQNQADRKRDGTHSMGERHGLAKLTEREALKILQDQRSYREIAADFGVSRSHICNIKARRHWSHLSLEAASQ